jgi:glycosyltransferase involved in cell wall biosynthesis
MGLEAEVHLNDFVLDVCHVYERADIILLASKYEGFPNVICEAMSYGKVIVASDVSDLSKWIQNGINGYIFHPEKPYELIQAIEWAFSLSTAQKQAIALQNKKLALELFGPNRIIQSYLNA